MIGHEIFDKVQALLQRDTCTSPKGLEVHLFSGFLKCADCGRAITRSVGNNNNVYYACSTYKNRSRTACTMHSIKHNRLEVAVLFAVQQQIHLAVSYSEMIARINAAPVKKSQSISLEELIAAKEWELAKISRYKQSLYQDWKDGEITQQDYRDTYFAEILQHPVIGRNFIRTKSVQSFQLARRPGISGRGPRQGRSRSRHRRRSRPQ